MPNWVQQKVIITGDAERLAYLKSAVVKAEPFQTILPMPFEHASSMEDGWEEWAIVNWGTKWDACDVSDVALKKLSNKKSKLTFRCNTAWTPPVPVWDELVRLGMDVSAAYVEEKMEFYGFYENGDDQRRDSKSLIDKGVAKYVSYLLDIDVDIDEKEYA